MNDTYDYTRHSYYQRQHHQRYTRYVEGYHPHLTCQEYGGGGGETVPVLDDGTGPWESCGWCEGTGLVSPHVRATWLRWKRQERDDEAARLAGVPLVITPYHL